MSEANDSPAFPGMTLRDWFAGRALAGLLAADGMSGIKEKCDPINGVRGPRWHNPENVAEAAYDLADAMIAARSQ